VKSIGIPLVFQGVIYRVGMAIVLTNSVYESSEFVPIGHLVLQTAISQVARVLLASAPAVSDSLPTYGIISYHDHN
jgi:hypothetical protein